MNAPLKGQNLRLIKY